jgi:hypothetical protein
MFSFSIGSARRIKETPRRRITVMSYLKEISNGTSMGKKGSSRERGRCYSARPPPPLSTSEPEFENV